MNSRMKLKGEGRSTKVKFLFPLKFKKISSAMGSSTLTDQFSWNIFCYLFNGFSIQSMWTSALLAKWLALFALVSSFFFYRNIAIAISFFIPLFFCCWRNQIKFLVRRRELEILFFKASFFFISSHWNIFGFAFIYIYIYK